MKKAMFLVLVAVLVFAIAAPAFAATGSVTCPAAATVLAKIEVSRGTKLVSFPAVGPDEKALASLLVMVKSNQAYSGDCAFEMDGSGVGILPKLAKVESGAPFDGPGMPGGLGVGSHTINFSFTPDWTVAAGSYTANVVVTVNQI